MSDTSKEARQAAKDAAKAKRDARTPYEKLIDSRAFGVEQIHAMVDAFDLDTTPSEKPEPIVQEDLYV